jgi:outer membrane protein TolC
LGIGFRPQKGRGGVTGCTCRSPGIVCIGSIAVRINIFFDMEKRGWKNRLLDHRMRVEAISALGCAFLAFVLAPGSAWSQTQTSQTQTSQTQTMDDSETAPAAPASAYAGGSNQSPFMGSVPEGKATSEVLPLSFKEAIDRGLRNNLGLLLESDSALAARGKKWKELSSLLPNLTSGISENVAQTNLQAEGLRFSGFPKIIGPYGFFDARVYMTQSLLDLHALDRERGATDYERAAQYSYKDARDLVVLAVGNAYLVTLSEAARVETSQAQVQTAQALYDKASDQQKAGVSPAIDALRARVELQVRQQQLIAVRNDYAKQMLTLARTIGLPPGQQFTLTDKAPYQPLAALGIEQSLERAFASRADYQAALQQLRAAEHFRKAATEEYFPTLGFAGDYGDDGITPGDSHGTFEASGTLRIPIFQGGKVHADVLQAEATLRQTRAQVEDLRGRIDFEVRSALLDLASAADQVETARSSVDLAQQTLDQAKDRFAAGVADNLEVVQAQESVAGANESYISSLYVHNVAKVALARAIGFAEEGVKLYLQSR